MKEKPKKYFGGSESVSYWQEETFFCLFYFDFPLDDV